MRFSNFLRLSFNAIILAGISSCGGSSSSDSGNSYPLTSNELYQYKTGDFLSYDISGTFTEYDGASARVSGTATVSFFTNFVGDGAFWDTVEPLIKRIDERLVNGTQSVTQSYFKYSPSGSYVEYLSGNNNFYSNQSNNASGIERYPSPLFSGLSWVVPFDVYEYNGVTHVISINFTVVSSETITVNGDEYGAYKIVFSGSGTDNGIFNGNLTISGNEWVNPFIGVVKRSTTYQKLGSSFGGPDTLVEIIELKEFQAGL